MDAEVQNSNRNYFQNVLIYTHTSHIRPCYLKYINLGEADNFQCSCGVDGSTQQRPAGVCRPTPGCRRMFLPGPRAPFPQRRWGTAAQAVSAERSAQHLCLSRAQPKGAPAQVRKEQGVDMSPYTSPLLGSNLLLPSQDSSCEWDTLGWPAAPRIRPPWVGSQDPSHHKPQGIPVWQYCSMLEKLPNILSHYDSVFLSLITAWSFRVSRSLMCTSVPM